MGGDSPELEAPDVVKAKAARADVQLLARGAMLDDPEPNAALAGSNGPVEDEEELVGICQICMDVVPRAQVVERVCGSRDCEGEVCAACLVQHAIATVYAFYAGVLPKVRCPMCLVPLNKRQWARFVLPEESASVVEASGNEPVAEEEVQESELVVAETETPEEGSTASDDAESSDSDSESEAGVQEEEEEEEEWVDDNSHVLDKYVMLCRQSCGFQSPCCHNTEYTMLPGAARRTETDALVLALTPEQEAGLPEFLAALRAFCFHKEDTDAVYEKLQSVFGDESEDVMWELLPRITDEERRAALLLHHLFVHPNTETRCCGEQVCFKCKASDHHDGNCNDFIEEESVLECRGCHVTLVKVEGCDTVACLCGYSFSWQEEVDRRRRQRCQLAPGCDREYVQWQRWHRLATRNFPKIENLDDTLRKARLAQLLRAHRPLLQRVIMARVERKRQQQLKHLNDVGEDSVANAAAA